MFNLRHSDVKSCIKDLANNIRAEKISQTSYLDLYSGAENISNIDNNNNTIIYGRRGSGKTHLLRALAERTEAEFPKKRNFGVYVDLRRFISLLPSGVSEPDLDAILTFKYIIQEVAYQLANSMPRLLGLNEFDGRNSLAINVQRDSLRTLFAKVYVEFDGRAYSKPQTLTVAEEERQSLAGGLKISANPEISVDGSREKATKSTELSGRYVSIFEITNILEDVMAEMSLSRITIFLDEWSEVESGTQLYLAELIKKTFSAINLCVKIAAIPNRTNLGIKTESKFVGLEDGGDISSYPLDMRYVFEVNKTQTRGFFNDLLLRHLRSIDNRSIKSLMQDSKKGEDSFINIFFANVALNEILVASAGIPRDFMNLFVKSYDRYLNSAKDSAKRISVKDLRSANAEWYEADKKEQVDKHPVEKQLLSSIVEEIVGRRKSMHFLVPEKYSGNKHIQNLIDFRVMHLRKSGYSHKDHVGISYNVYSIDYGCYNSINVSKATLDTLALSDLNVKELRDIRRISLEEQFFDKILMQVGEAFPCPKCRKPVDVNHLAYTKQSLCNNCFEVISAA